MWNELVLPRLPAPIRGYTHVNDSALFVLTKMGLFGLNLKKLHDWEFVAPSISSHMVYAGEYLQFDEYGALIWHETYMPLFGYSSDDCPGCSDLHLSEHSESGALLRFDADTDTLFVISPANLIELTIRPFGAIDNNWASAGFSHDGKHLTVAGLAAIRVFEYLSHPRRVP